MGEANAPIAHLHDPGALGLVECAAPDVRDRLDERERRLCEGGGGRERVPRLRPQGAEPCANELVEGHRQPLAGLEAQRPRLERPAQLECEEGVAARQLVDAQEHRPRRQRAEPVP